MDFSLALALLKQGHSIRRTGWNGKNQTLHLQESDSKMTLPFIYLEFPAGSDSRGRVPWTATQTDLLANDWMVVNQLAKAPQTAQEPPKRRGRPKGATKAKKATVRDPEAPYGRKLDGTPKAAPGRKKAAPADVSTPAAQ
jgi:hypothetical protein